MKRQNERLDIACEKTPPPALITSVVKKILQTFPLIAEAGEKGINQMWNQILV